MSSSIYGERVARLEERMERVEKSLDSMDGKIDELLELKNKGAGILAFLALGAGLMAFIVQVVHWIKGA